MHGTSKNFGGRGAVTIEHYYQRSVIYLSFTTAVYGNSSSSGLANNHYRVVADKKSCHVDCFIKSPATVAA